MRAQRALGTSGGTAGFSSIRSLFPSSSRRRPAISKATMSGTESGKPISEVRQVCRSAAAACACTRPLLPWPHRAGLLQQAASLPRQCSSGGAAGRHRPRAPAHPAAAARHRLICASLPFCALQRISEAAGAAAQRASDTWEATKEKAAEVRGAARSSDAAAFRNCCRHGSNLHRILPVSRCAAVPRKPCRVQSSLPSAQPSPLTRAALLAPGPCAADRLCPAGRRRGAGPGRGRLGADQGQGNRDGPPRGWVLLASRLLASHLFSIGT